MGFEPAYGIHECPTCGVDAARALIVASVVAFYQPMYKCYECSIHFATLQSAANHMSKHKPDLIDYVNEWISEHGEGWELRRRPT